MFYILHVNYATRAVQRITDVQCIHQCPVVLQLKEGIYYYHFNLFNISCLQHTKKDFFAVVVRPRLVYTYRYIHNCILITWPHGNLWLKMDWCWKMYGIIWILFDFSLKHGNLVCSHFTNRHVALFWTNGRGDLSKILINKKTNILKQNQIRQSS